MFFNITHTTEYRYSGKVFFEPHVFRFKPKSTPHSKIKEFKIEIVPEPTGFSEQIDIENNHIILCWFDDTHTELKIITHSLVEVQEYNPFNYLVYPHEYLKIPFKYNDKTNQLLKPSLKKDELTKEMIFYLNKILLKNNNSSIDFIVELTKAINKDFVLQSRENGEPHKPDYTFNNKKGSCRDLVWMQIHMLRHVGIASRFVSGYYFVDIENPKYELHAWVEVYLPGAGWIGLDPGHGIKANAHHIPVASSAYYENTMPVSGTIRGEAIATMKNEMNINKSLIFDS